jgi:serine/threonine-protein kinase
MTQENIGTRKGDYEVLALLGVGGMGQVYKVRNVLSDRVEAMKVLLPNLADQKMLADRFIREIKVLAGLHHPNIAELRTALTIDNQLVMIMEFVEGTTLAARVQQGGLPYGRALSYIQQVLSALSYAHAQRIVHRDIKPSNMMLTPTGIVKLMDFGIARQDGDVALTMTHSTVGSIAYMSPEQVKGEPVDARSDLYSVGVSLYELVTGQRPFVGDTGFSIMRAHLETMPKPPIELRPDLPVAISDLILMAVAKEPAKRFQSADAFSRAIASVVPVVEGTAPAIAAALPPSDPTMMSPPALGETMLPGSATTPFQATQLAAAPPSAPQAVAASPRISSAPAKPAAAMPMPPPQNNYRGFYIALGALIVLVVLAAAGFYVPRHMKALAAQQSSSSADSSSSASPSPSSSSSDASSNSSQPAASSSSDSANSSSANSASNASAPAASASSNAPASGSGAAPAKASNSQGSSAPASVQGQHIFVAPRNGAARASSASSSQVQGIYVPPRTGAAQSASASSSPSPSDSATSAPAPSNTADVPSGAAAKPATADAAQLQDVETEVDQLSSRASSVTTSLNSLRQQQATQGLTLRGDMTAAEQRMQTNLSKAQSALQAQDPAQAKHYLDLAEPDVEKLEKFLGH